ncbi:unnamed protein product [Schistosoma mattheei]|uniref:Uncharacterized protein n=1 Tax=Schistosoma mattheei TaxID=31246 RepID=A0A183NUQ4_9TREM|nr:unnamed protein product [Schistosoma mattheei]
MEINCRKVAEHHVFDVYVLLCDDVPYTFDPQDNHHHQCIVYAKSKQKQCKE